MNAQMLVAPHTAERVKQILLASKSTTVADTLVEDLMRIETGTNRDEVKWTDVAVHASQILSASNKVVFVTASRINFPQGCYRPCPSRRTENYNRPR